MANDPMKRGAVISDCGKYRYSLTREWGDAAGRCCVFIMLNPSTADSVDDDPTITRCINFAKREHCARLMVLNLFAFRTAYPKELRAADAPEGDPTNLNCIRSLIGSDALVIAGWGLHGKFRKRANAIKWALRQRPVYALEINADGSPKHPLFVRGDTPIKPFNECALASLAAPTPI